MTPVSHIKECGRQANPIDQRRRPNASSDGNGADKFGSPDRFVTLRQGCRERVSGRVVHFGNQGQPVVMRNPPTTLEGTNRKYDPHRQTPRAYSNAPDTMVAAVKISITL